MVKRNNKNLWVETEEEKIKKAMQIPPEKKLEILYRWNVFIDRVLTKKQKIIRRRLREEF